VSRIDRAFRQLRARGERALIPYFTAGDPALGTTRELLEEAAGQGADLLELGVPFSDPLADGPVIQRASQRALARGVTLSRVLELVREARGAVSVPLVLLTYYNPILAFGLKAFAVTAVDAGVDGVIVPDLPPEEAGPLDREARAAGLDLIHLVAPTSPPARIRTIARRSRGFVYAVSLTGVTGARAELPPELTDYLRDLRSVTTKPICVGFGISTPEQVRALAPYVDGVIVGSAIVRQVEAHQGSDRLIPEIGRFIASLKAPLRHRGSGTGDGGSFERPPTP
jgi:tryptophan synthase alpha chain